MTDVVKKVWMELRGASVNPKGCHLGRRPGDVGGEPCFVIIQNDGAGRCAPHDDRRSFLVWQMMFEWELEVVLPNERGVGFGVPEKSSQTTGPHSKRPTQKLLPSLAFVIIRTTLCSSLLE